MDFVNCEREEVVPKMDAMEGGGELWTVEWTGAMYRGTPPALKDIFKDVFSFVLMSLFRFQPVSFYLVLEIYNQFSDHFLGLKQHLI